MRYAIFATILIVYVSLLAFAVWSVIRLMPINGRPLAACTTIVTLIITALMISTLLPVLDTLPMGVSVAVYQTGNTVFMASMLTGLAFLLIRLLVLCHILPAEWFRNNPVTLIVYFAAIVGLFTAGYFHYMHKQRIAISVDGQPVEQPLRLVMVSDLHLGYHNRRDEARRWVNLINKEKPDAVVIVGDLVDHSTRAIIEQDMMAELRQLEAPTFMVLGNHEYMAQPDKVKLILDESHITLLRDSVVSVKGVTIIGRDDFTNRHRKSLHQLMSQAPQGEPTIVLDHQPREIDEAASEGVTLLLCGHTHNGQVWPISWIVRLLYKNAYGLKRFSNTDTYVSSGLGIWGAKARIGSQSEYVVVDIKK